MKRTKFSDYETRIRAVKAVLKGDSVATVARCYGRDRTAVHRWVKKYRKHKTYKCLQIGKRAGRPKKIDSDVCKRLIKDVLKPATRFGFETDFWTCRRIVTHLKSKYKIKTSQSTMWRQLTNARLSYQKPERRYFEKDPKKQREWIEQELPRINETVKKYKAILYFEDESCIRLTPVLGKTWSPKGKTPIHQVTGNRGSISAISAISGTGSLIFNLQNTKVNSDGIIKFLTQMLKHHPRRHLVVVMDQAKPHIANKVKNFVLEQKRLHVFYLPPRSPELNPDEKVWCHLKNEELKSHQARNLEQLTKLTAKKLKQMSKNPSLLRGIFFRCIVAKLLN